MGSGDELAAQIVDLEREVAVEWFSLDLPPALGPTGAWRCAEPHERGKRARYAAVKKHYAEISAKLNRGRKWRALDDGVWFGISAPAATPSDIVAKLNAAVNTAVQHPDVRGKLAKLDITTEAGTPESFGRQIASQLVYWRGAMAAAGVKPE